MIMENNNSKEVLLSVLGVAILVVAVVGVSFAAFTFSQTGNVVNQITTGTISMSYSEPENGITLTNAMPMEDATPNTDNNTCLELLSFILYLTSFYDNYSIVLIIKATIFLKKRKKHLKLDTLLPSIPNNFKFNIIASCKSL